MNPQPLEDSQESKIAIVESSTTEAEVTDSDTLEPEPLESVRNSIQSLFNTVGVQRIIYVDDRSTAVGESSADSQPAEALDDETLLSEVLGLLPEIEFEGEVPLECLDGVNFTADEAVQRRQIEIAWPNLSEEQKLEVYKIFHEQAGATERLQNENTEVLQSVMARYEFIPLSLKAWQERKEEFLADVETQPTLFLFDRDFRREVNIEDPVLRGREENAGIILMLEVCHRTKQKKTHAFCGLVSYTLKFPTEAERWGELADEHQIDRSRCIPIPRQCIDRTSGHLHEFVRRIKFTVLAGDYDVLTTEIANLLKTSTDVALEKIKSVPPYDLDYLIFQRSKYEGLWEPDTLFRLFALYIRKESLVRARENTITNLTDRIRTVSDVHSPTPPGLLGKKTYRELQNLELYDDDSINNSYSPLECGDIFETGDYSNGRGKHWVLLAQPCDLMLRRDGNRKLPVGTLIQIVKKGIPKFEQTHCFEELPYYEIDEVEGQRWWMDFRTKKDVPLCVLELCTFREDGKAVFTMSDEAPATLSPACKARFEKASSDNQGVLTEYKKFNTQLNDRQFNEIRQTVLLTWIKSKFGLASASDTPIKPAISADAQSVEFKIRRRGRLHSSRAAHALVRFHYSEARTAFDMDMGLVPTESGDSSNNIAQKS